ncbi:hypothetical protein LKL89_18920 [Bacillus cereus]|uniref:hypothetical protein n=1 Tax=Bacillus cereus group TaxID=86661 RepID=UPI001E374064|nr:hypothetical protein [Bacillus cereus]MCC2445910.1 hypothetical protein [Bacillus cereus]MDG1604816.1 hypothetical protein [Bacillus paranthracis]
MVLKNTGKEYLGDINRMYESSNEIKVYIETNEKLKTVSEEVKDFNIYNEEERLQENLDLSEGGMSVLKPNQEGDYTFNFVF